MHSADFGGENKDLLEAVERAGPEYIFLVGDLLDAFHEIPESYAERTARDLAAIAPTCYVTGNHEWAIGGVPELKETLAEQGITVLSNTFTILQRGGDSILLAGIDDPNGYADQKPPETVAAEVYAAYGDPFWILLAHRNDHFPTQYCKLGADLVVSGHGHGGLVRLPFTDGLVSTDRTFFPSYTAGALSEKRLHTLRHKRPGELRQDLPALQPSPDRRSDPPDCLTALRFRGVMGDFSVINGGIAYEGIRRGTV